MGLAHLVTSLEIQFVGMSRFEVVDDDVQIRRQQTMCFLENENVTSVWEWISVGLRSQSIERSRQYELINKVGVGGVEWGLPGDVLRVRGTAMCWPRTATSPSHPADRRCHHAFHGWRRAACGPDARGSMGL